MIKLTIPAGHKLDKCAAKESPRYGAMENILAFRHEHRTFLCASNAKILAVLPVDCEEIGEEIGEPILLPAKSVSTNGKGRTVEVNGEVRSTDGKKTDVYPLPAPRPGEENIGRFPGLRGVLPKDEEIVASTVLRIDARLLADLANAISHDGIVTLLIPEVEQGKQVEKVISVVGQTESGERSIGAIVPLAPTHDDVAFRMNEKMDFMAARNALPSESISF